MVWRNLSNAAVVAAALVLNSCSGTSERNIIMGQPPFFHGTVPYDQADTARVISAVQRFADANGMDFALSKDEPDTGDYNANAVRPDLNLKAVHVGAITPASTEIFAVSRSVPTEADKAVAREFVCVVRGKCQS